MSTLTDYMQRAGVRSRRELSKLTGIAHTTMDAIFDHPSSARGYQLAAIMQALGLTQDELIGLITRGGR